VTVEVLERVVGEPATQVDFSDGREHAPLVAVGVTEPWFILGRHDRCEYRLVSASRLKENLGRDYDAWWLYPDEAFDSQQEAALALADILDPAGWRQKPRRNVLILDRDVGELIARLDSGQREAMATAIDFVVDKILIPFGETTSFDSWQQADREAGQPWTAVDYDDAIRLLQTLQALMEGNNAPIIIGSQTGADVGDDSGDRADRAA